MKGLTPEYARLVVSGTRIDGLKDYSGKPIEAWLEKTATRYILRDANGLIIWIASIDDSRPRV